MKIAAALKKRLRFQTPKQAGEQGRKRALSRIRALALSILFLDRIEGRLAHKYHNEAAMVVKRPVNKGLRRYALLIVYHKGWQFFRVKNRRGLPILQGNSPHFGG